MALLAPKVHAKLEESVFSAGMNSMSDGLVRPRDRWIAGVCSGLARRFGTSPGFVRLLFVVSCLLPGPQVLIYIMLWIMMPSE
jgi:phage shock protein PspC (stress-responsive transcriptional regulator)